MDNVDLEVLRNAAEWIGAGRRARLVTVVRTWGSAPRPAGSMLAVRDDGLVVGSVSGGCIEDDIVERTRREGSSATRCEVATYGVSADEARRFRLPCGGTIHLVLEPLTRESGIGALLREVEAGRFVARRLDLVSGVSTLDAAHAGERLEFDGKVLRTLHGPRYRMLVIGASHLSKFLAGIAIGLGFDVTVCDPRDEYTEAWDEPGVRIVRTMPDDTVRAMRLDEWSAVIALTHDPKLDDLALIEALKSRAFYVGAIGSRASQAKRRARLREFELGDDEIARLRGPIGIPIGRRTPPEIAVSIAAEVIATRNGVGPRDTASMAVHRDAPDKVPDDATRTAQGEVLRVTG